jgi:DnaJ family protein A protein 2
MSDLLGSMFGMGGMGGRGKPSGPKKAKPVLHKVKANLTDLYNGKLSKISVSRDRICSKCEGKGGKTGAV